MEAPSGDLNRYRIGEMLGPPGGWGAAYAADRDDGIHCVVKLIHGLQNPLPEEVERLQAVLARLTTVDSPHVVKVIDAGIDRGSYGGAVPWIAMLRMVGARSLDQVLRPPDRPPIAWALRVARGVAAGLKALHDAGLLHRDLKPGNILVDGRGHAWLIDFELIKILGMTTATRRSQEPVGTPPYMSPEQLVGPVTPASDLWALGLVIHELLAGEHPLETHLRMGSRGLARAINSPGLVSAATPERYRPLVSALLRKIPAARPADAGTVLRWLEDPGAVSLDPAEPAATPPIRWSVAERAEFDAAEAEAAAALDLHALDVRRAARGDGVRLRRAASRLGTSLAFEPSPPAQEMLPLDPALVGIEDEVEREVLGQLVTARGGGHDETLLPFAHADADAQLAVHTTRVGVRHGDQATGELIGTVRCSAALLEDPARASELLAACSVLGVDGWRLIVEGLEPGCRSETLRAARDAAEALACGGRQVWLMAAGLQRWIALATAGVSICYRAGRELWIAPNTGGGPPRPERVEVDRLAGPIPRAIAQALALDRPDLVLCPCPSCAASTEPLPPAGRMTIAHNVFVVEGQVRRARAGGAERVREMVAEAEVQRGEISERLGWHAELEDAQRVLAVVDGLERAVDSRPHLLLAS